MIEDVLVLIIRELGPTGCLIVGLYLILAKPLNTIAKHIEIINEETGQVRDELKEISRALCRMSDND